MNASNLADYASNAARTEFPAILNQADNSADAFRHGLWSAAMTLEIGVTEAKSFGDAHEVSNSGGLAMDLINNHNGRVLAQKNPNHDPKNIILNNLGSLAQSPPEMTEDKDSNGLDCKE